MNAPWSHMCHKWIHIWAGPIYGGPGPIGAQARRPGPAVKTSTVLKNACFFMIFGKSALPGKIDALFCMSNLVGLGRSKLVQNCP